jgi:SnoaL-like polyketide cyclase
MGSCGVLDGRSTGVTAIEEDPGRGMSGSSAASPWRVSATAEQTGAVIDLLERLLPLWTRPVDSWDDAGAAFREVYADPVVVNGTEMPVVDLVGRARALQQAFDGLSMDILDTAEAPGRVVIAFLMRGRHVGPFTSPLGTVAPTQRDIEVRTIDVLVISKGLVSAIWVVSDDLGLLRQLDAVRLT